MELRFSFYSAPFRILINIVLRRLGELPVQNLYDLLFCLNAGCSSHNSSILEINGKWQPHERCTLRQILYEIRRWSIKILIAECNIGILLDEALEACEQEGAEIVKIDLREMEINDCVGCIPCPEKCVTGDDAWDTFDTIKDADGIILASPSYGGSSPGLMKSFMDRSVYIGRKHKTGNLSGFSGALANKVGASISVGASSGMQFVNLEHIIWFLKYKMFIASEDKTLYMGLAAAAHDAGEIREDKEALENARILGRRVIEIIRLTGRA